MNLKDLFFPMWVAIEELNYCELDRIKRNNYKLSMENLPKKMIADRDNVVYYDTEIGEFYLISWEDGGNRDIPTRHYIKNNI